LGWFWLQHERYDAAEAAFARALELSPENLDVMIGLARIYGGRHDYETAESWLEKAEAL
jgi:cytochrome c-type biogenesis protein CcmH/NrfG